jgi:hypothetical protein
MTSHEAFENTVLNSRSIWIFDEKSNSYPQSGHVQATWVVWQTAIEWASKQATEAIAGVRASEEDDVYNSYGNDIATRCETAIKKALK